MAKKPTTSSETVTTKSPTAQFKTQKDAPKLPPPPPNVLLKENEGKSRVKNG